MLLFAQQRAPNSKITSNRLLHLRAISKLLTAIFLGLSTSRVPSLSFFCFIYLM